MLLKNALFLSLFFAFPFSGFCAAVKPNFPPPAFSRALPELEDEKIIKTFWERASYLTGLNFYLDSRKIMPGFFFSMREGKNSFSLSYSWGSVPHVDDQYSFLRSARVPVKRTQRDILVNGSTVTYSNDEISKFETRTHLINFTHRRRLADIGDFLSVSVVEGLSLAYHKYDIECLLEDNSRYSEKDEAWGIGLEAGISAGFGGEMLLSKGFFTELGILWRKLWFDNSGAGVAGTDLRKELNGIKALLLFGWMF